MNDLNSQEIARRLAAARPQPGAPFSPEFPALPELLSGTPRPASVLIPLLWREHTWHLLYTRRNDLLAEHSGQVAFPGGRADADDCSPEMTALREAHEEVGLDPADVVVLGRLPDHLTITNYRVTPVVGMIPWPYTLRLQEQEVSRAFTIPLAWLSDPENYDVKLRPLPEPHGVAEVIYYHPYDGETLWGASARFTQSLIRVLSAAGANGANGAGQK